MINKYHLNPLKPTNFTLIAYFCDVFDQIVHILMFINFPYIWETLTYIIGTLEHCKTQENSIKCTYLWYIHGNFGNFLCHLTNKKH